MSKSKTEGKLLSKQDLSEVLCRAAAGLVKVPTTETTLYKVLNELYYLGEIEGGEYPEALEDPDTEYVKFYRDYFITLPEAME